MEPGDFVLWDSREAHYGAAPKRDKKRFCICELLRSIGGNTLKYGRYLLQA